MTRLLLLRLLRLCKLGLGLRLVDLLGLEEGSRLLQLSLLLSLRGLPGESAEEDGLRYQQLTCRLSGAAIAGIVAGVVVVVLILQAILIWFCCRRQLLALVSHRKQMRGREVKRGGDVDLVSQLGDPNDVILDETRSGARHTHSGSNYTALNTATTRESSGGGYAQSSISPFWDGNRVSQSQYTLDVDLGPPLVPHTRNNSLGSTPELPDTGSMHSPSSPLVGPGYFPHSASGSRPINSNSLSSMSKAQLASSFAPTNPDRDDHRLDNNLGSEGRLPPLAAPSGGFVREQDAGSLGGGGREEDTEHLPPMYDPQWQSQDRGGSDR
jgi:hypothetical protein